MSGYNLGAVKPHVRAAAELVGGRFDVATVHGFGLRANSSDHPRGLALDFMVEGAKGDQLAAYVQQNAGALGVTYVIWRQRIWSVARAGEGWRPMRDRGSRTANHYDHVHVSFGARAGTGAPLPTIPVGTGGATVSPAALRVQTAGYDAQLALGPFGAPLNPLKLPGWALGKAGGRAEDVVGDALGTLALTTVAVLTGTALVVLGLYRAAQPAPKGPTP